MEKEKLKRIAVIGLPGSGKSTFATRLGKMLSISVHHLDKHMFDGRTKRDKRESIEELRKRYPKCRVFNFPPLTRS